MNFFDSEGDKSYKSIKEKYDRYMEYVSSNTHRFPKHAYEFAVGEWPHYHRGAKATRWEPRARTGYGTTSSVGGLVMHAPISPIFIVEGLDVTVHRSVEEAALWLEPWWVEQNLGAAYDAEGRLLKFGIAKYNVVISLGERTPGHASELRSILISFLNAVGEPVEIDSDDTLSTLVELCVNRQNFPSVPDA